MLNFAVYITIIFISAIFSYIVFLIINSTFDLSPYWQGWWQAILAASFTYTGIEILKECCTNE